MKELLIKEFSEIFKDIELIIRKKTKQEKHDEYIDELNSIGYSDIISKLNKLLRKTKRKYNKAKKLYYNGELTEKRLKYYQKSYNNINRELKKIK